MNLLPLGENVDLQVCNYGYEVCSPGHSYGPAVREYYLFHYIFSGKGFFRTSENTYFLHEGLGFLIYPNDLNYYQADLQNPWTYGWFGISGIYVEEYLRECGLSRKDPIWKGGQDERIEKLITDMNSANQFDISGHLQITGCMYQLLSRMIEKASLLLSPLHHVNRQTNYVQAAISYIEQNYHKNIRIGDIAKFVGLDRSYLGSLFKKHLHTSMQHYLAQLRIQKACTLMQNAELRISDIARSVGYDDQLQFSKVFKLHLGVSPMDYKRKTLGLPYNPSI